MVSNQNKEQDKTGQVNTAIINLENQEYTTYSPIVKINKKNVVFISRLYIYLY